MTSILTILATIISLANANVTVLEADYQVIQRTDNHGSFVIEMGTILFEDIVTVKITDEKGMPVFEKMYPAKQSEEQAGLMIENVPVGGPYLVSVTVTGRKGEQKSKKTFSNILIGDLWILAGQSNMAGAPQPEPGTKPVPGINMQNFDGRWLPALPPLHRIYETEAPVIIAHFKHWGGTDESIKQRRKQSRTVAPVGNVGPGFFFASEVYEKTGVPIGVIPCALGAASIEDWNPEKKAQGDGSLYGFMYNRVMATGGKVKGMLWYQGEADASPYSKNNEDYGECFKKFVEAVRGDFNNPDLPIITAQISRYMIIDHMEYAQKWENIREAQRMAAREIPNVYMISTIDLEMHDLIHIALSGQKKVGHRMANIAIPIVKDGSSESDGIQFRSARFMNKNRSAIEVIFNNVTGKLSAPGRAHGFELRAKGTRNKQDVIHRIDFDPDKPDTAILRLRPYPDGEVVLLYGAGKNPYANLVDDAGMAVPAFGPVEIN